jgi:hypothetical protein
VRCLEATASSFVTKVSRFEVFARFQAFAINVTAVCRIDCLACHYEFFMNIPFDVKENDEHAS